MFQVKCVKCQEKYEDIEPDDYYCPPCKVEHLKLAEEVQRKVLANGPSRLIKSDLQRYDEIRKEKGVNFVNIRDLI